MRAIELARAEGFDNISLDLIYGLPSQTKNDWADTLVKALDLRPEHISCYGLKLEEETPMYGVYGGSPFLPTDDDQADMYLYAVETMERYAYSQYEISNFSVPGKASRHNMKYWTGEPYIGFGPGAHSYVDGVRYSFVRDLSGYISGVQGGKQVVDEYEKLDGMGRGSEYIMLGMRTTRGISAEEYNEIYRSSFAPIKDQLREFEYKGWAVFENGRWHFTSQGFLLSNQLINMLLEAQAEQKLIMNPWVRDFSGVFGEKTELPPGDEVFYRNRQQHTET